MEAGAPGPELPGQEGEGVSSYSVISHPGVTLPTAYRPMVLSKWLRSLRFGNDYFRLVDQDAYFRVYHDHIETLIARPGAVVRLAVLTDDHDVVLGFCVHNANVLHYAHVHKDMRKQGIGRALLPQGIDTISHVTYIGLSIWGKFPGWKLDPFQH